MPRPFIGMTLSEFAEQLNRYQFSRPIREVHMHHTWRPRQGDYRGEPTVAGMWRHHTQTNGWSDIAQHLSIAPDGSIWTGRSWNRTPASASGHNAGAFMFETIGDFDRGRDSLVAAQRAAVVEVIARVQLKCGLAPESLRFHREFSTKTCPGSGIDKEEILREVRGVRERIERVERLFQGFRTREIPGEGSPGLDEPFDPRQRTVPPEAWDAEVECGPPVPAPEPGAARGFVVTAEMRDALRPHVINLALGRLSGSGAMSTSPEEVDAIFREHLPRALEEARGRGEPLRLMFHAHGGLVSEASGTRMAHDLIPWWRANGVYPVYFVWETGLWETLSRLLTGRRELEAAGARGMDELSDRMLEEVARRAGGGTIWGGMKYSAERSVGRDGGARHVAQRLAEFSRAQGASVELHAVGHSAGSIFHSHFLPVARELGAPGFRTLHLLAPAIRTEAFRERLGPLVGEGRGIDHLTMFTMRRDFEEADHCGRIYRKSLLCLVSGALEPRRGQPLLGLESSVRADAELQRLFGLGGGSGAPGEVVWSRTEAERGRSASRATTHGGFDNDPATMESVLRRVLGVDDWAAIVPFPEQARRAAHFTEPGAEDPAALAEDRPVEAPSEEVTPVGAAGRRRALCIGIDRYPAPYGLAGCVGDARLWARTLEQLGFERPVLLLDEQATRGRILGEMERLVEGSRPGDVLVLQYAGHGTRFHDRDGEEGDRYDEALVPVDMGQGHFILDDEQHEVLARLPEGVSLTCLFDCCHSGTNTRALLTLLGSGTPAAGGGGPRPRSLAPTPEMRAEYARRPRGRAGRAARDRSRLRWVSFAACQDEEVALEQDGQGMFTRQAAPLLREAVEGRLTNRELARRVTEALGPDRPQTPHLDASDETMERPVLASTAAPMAQPPTVDIATLSRPAWDLLLGRLRELRPEELRALVREANQLLDGA